MNASSPPSVIERGYRQQPDFVEPNEGNVRLKPNAVTLLLTELGELLAMRVICNNKKHKRPSIIEIKTRELMMYIDGRLDYVDFSKPIPNIPEGKWFLRI